MLAAFIFEKKTMRLKYLTIAAVLASAASPASSLTQNEVKRCNAMAASFAAKKAEIITAKSALDEKVELVEAAGERWEAAEEMRLMSPQSANDADSSKANWESLKSEVMREQMALQSRVQMLNKDMAAFNASCATD